MSEQISVNDIAKEVLEYAKANFGARCGPDFPEISTALAQAEAFASFVRAQALGTAVIVALLGPPKESGDASIDKWVASLPVSEALHTAFYMGMKYGEKRAEVKALEHMAGSE